MPEMRFPLPCLTGCALRGQCSSGAFGVVPAVGGADKVACDAADAVESAAFADDDGFCIFLRFG